MRYSLKSIVERSSDISTATRYIINRSAKLTTYATLSTLFSHFYRRDVFVWQNEDGGWGLHIEGHSTMFCTTLNYICARILGEGPNGGPGNACKRAREWILGHGGATHIPSWGKTWLSVYIRIDFFSKIGKRRLRRLF